MKAPVSDLQIASDYSNARYAWGMAKTEHDSPLAAALASVGDRWTLHVVAALLDGPRRFGDLQEEVGGIAPNVLSQRLRRLEDDGLVIAQPYSERPPRFVYELSEAGRGLAGVLRLLVDWGARHSAPSRRATRRAGPRWRPSGTARRATRPCSSPTRGRICTSPRARAACRVLNGGHRGGGSRSGLRLGQGFVT